MNISLAFFMVFLVSLPSLLAGIFLSDTLGKKQVLFLISLAVGALFGDAFFHLLPESFEVIADARIISFLVIGGIFIFFFLEKFLHWRHEHIHTHTDDCDKRIHPVATNSLVSDALHNALDGALIMASFLTSLPLGFATAFAILLHEIPQEIGDIGILIHAGFSRNRAVLFNFLFALSAFVGAGLVAIFSVSTEAINLIAHYSLPLAAGGFIYIAGSDLVPELHKETGLSEAIIQFFGIFLGLLLMLGLLLFS